MKILYLNQLFQGVKNYFSSQEQYPQKIYKDESGNEVKRPLNLEECIENLVESVMWRFQG
ncbi:MAG: hypothetical protein AABY22_07250 [Nanoarchaeota archaeon]